MGIPLDKAELLALFLENIIYGIFLTFFVILIVISLARDPIRIANQRFVLPVASVMMVLATTHLVLDFVRVIQGFVADDPMRPPNPIAYYGKISHPLHVAKTLIYGLQTLLGDAVLIWRCYIVNNRSLYVIIPGGVVLLTNVAITGVIIWTFTAAVPGASIFQTGAHFIESFFIITMVLNLCCTIAIVLKAWRTHQRVTSNNGRSLFPVMAVIIESGAIYTASVTGLLIAFLSGSNGQYPALDVITPLVGVVYCLIILQIHFHLRLSHLSSGAASSGSLHAWRRAVRVPTYEFRAGVAVRITEHAETHTDPDSDAANPKTRLDDMS